MVVPVFGKWGVGLEWTFMQERVKQGATNSSEGHEIAWCRVHVSLLPSSRSSLTYEPTVDSTCQPSEFDGAFLSDSWKLRVSALFCTVGG